MHKATTVASANKDDNSGGFREGRWVQRRTTTTAVASAKDDDDGGGFGEGR